MRVIVLHEDEAKALIAEAVRQGAQAALSDWEALNVASNGPSVSLLDKRAAAELLNCSVSTVDQLKRNGEIPFYRVGTGVRFKELDLLEYIERQRMESDF